MINKREAAAKLICYGNKCNTNCPLFNPFDISCERTIRSTNELVKIAKSEYFRKKKYWGDTFQKQLEKEYKIICGTANIV